MEDGTAPAWQDAMAIEILRLAQRVAPTLVDNSDDADDVAQQVVLTCIEKLRSGELVGPPSHLTQLVCLMVRQATLDLRRRKRNRSAREKRHGDRLFDATNDWMNPERALEANELNAFHEKTLRDLPETCRRAFVLVRQDRTTYRAAAQRLGLTRLAVCAHVVAAHAAFRKGLELQGIEAPPARPLRRSVHRRECA